MKQTLTIEDLINKLAPEGVVLKAGKKGIHNKIMNVNTIDNPDTMDWLLAGDFILTTGYIYKDNVALQKQLVQGLVEQNCAGLGCKVKRYWDEIPETIIQEANRLNLPVIEIPYRFSLSQIANQINEEVHNRSSSLVNKYRDIHSQMSQCNIKGGNLSEIATLTSKLISNPVIIIDSQFNLLSFAEKIENPHQLSNYIQLNEREKVFPKFFNDSIPTDPNLFTLSIKRKISFDTTEITCRIIPISYSHVIYGYIIVWETVKKLESIDYIALEYAAQSCAIERVKTRQILESQVKIRKDFFDDLLNERILSVNAIKNTAHKHGLRPEQNYVVCVIQSEQMTNKVLQECLDVVEDEAMRIKYTVRTVILEQELIIFVELTENELFELSDDVKNFFQAIHESLKKTFSTHDFRLGVSNICKDFIKIGKSYHLAQDVLRVTSKFSKKSGIFYFSEFASYHLLDAFDNIQQLKNFYDTVLGALHYYDQINGSNLVETLETYFAINMNITQGAKQLYIHRNTFIYRLDKIMKILKTDLKEPETVFNIQLALKIKKVI